MVVAGGDGKFINHLCVFISNDCSRHKHIDYIKEKARGRINVMRRLKIFFDRKSLETIYLTFIRSGGYKTFFMLNSAEHESYPAHKC